MKRYGSEFRRLGEGGEDEVKTPTPRHSYFHSTQSAMINSSPMADVRSAVPDVFIVLQVERRCSQKPYEEAWQRNVRAVKHGFTREYQEAREQEDNITVYAIIINTALKWAQNFGLVIVKMLFRLFAGHSCGSSASPKTVSLSEPAMMLYSGLHSMTAVWPRRRSLHMTGSILFGSSSCCRFHTSAICWFPLPPIA